MKSCNGIVGKIFGHRFISELQEYTPNIEEIVNFKGSLKRLTEHIQAKAHKKYIIICIRCGRTPMEVRK